MAKLNTGLNAGLLVPISNVKHSPESRDNKWHSGNKTVYTYDCKHRKEDPTKIVKWLRKNFGERSVGWDFYFAGGCVIIEVWEDRLKTMYEMWMI